MAVQVLRFELPAPRTVEMIAEHGGCDPDASGLITRDAEGNLCVDLDDENETGLKFTPAFIRGLYKILNEQ